jgi:hypothetical protein
MTRAARTAEDRLFMGRDHLVRLALALAVAAPLVMAAGALGTRAGLWDWRTGLLEVTGGLGVDLAWVAVAVSLMAVYGVAVTQSRRGLVWAGAALALSAVVIATLLMIRAEARSVPPIHHISTDIENPPAFSDAAVAERGPDANSLDLATARLPVDPRFGAASGALVTDLQRATWPDIRTLEVSGAPASVFPVARAAMVAQGIEITREDADSGRIEGVHTSFWFGFRDDVVVRLVTTPTGRTRVDVRSVSRVGLSDLGANARRVRAILADIRVALERQTGKPVTKA